jgi:hypothetical protein
VVVPPIAGFATIGAASLMSSQVTGRLADAPVGGTGVDLA